MKKFYLLLLSIFLGNILAMAIKKDPIKVACVGNSITAGAFLHNQSKDAYPGILEQMLGNEYDVRNFGMSGRTVLKKGNKPYMKTQIYKDALNYNPSIVTIKLGTNDTKPINWKYSEEFKDDLTELVNSFKNLPSKPRIILCLPVPAPKTGNPINDSILVNEVIPKIKEVAQNTGSEILDLYHPMLQYYPDYYTDKVHPNVKGANVLAKLIYKYITGKQPDYKVDNDNKFPGRKTSWEGYDRYDFVCAGRNAIVVTPKNAAKGNPWIWRPAFFGLCPFVDKILLNEGYHIVYYDMDDFYGGDSIKLYGNLFYSKMVKYYKLNPRVVLEGFSSGGLAVFKWASENSSKISCIYLDASVCDINSWLGGNKEKLCNDMLQNKDINSNFKVNAIHSLQILAKAGIPIISVCGYSDTTIPYKENMLKIKEEYTKLGGLGSVIFKEGNDYHPYSIKESTQIVDFILRYKPSETEKICDIKKNIDVDSYFQSNMLFQQNSPIVVWGTAAPNVEFETSFGKESKVVKVGNDGKWEVSFESRPASFEPYVMKIGNKKYENILIGDLWICSGQSNMVWPLNKTEQNTQNLEGKDKYMSSLRLMSYTTKCPLVAPKGYSEELLRISNHRDFYNKKWNVASSEVMSTYSAIAGRFGLALAEYTKVPIGIVFCAIGGSSIYNWIPQNTLEKYEPTSGWFSDGWLNNKDIDVSLRNRAKKALVNVLRDKDDIVINNSSYHHMCEPSFLFEAGLANIGRINIKGILWYQGEADASNEKAMTNYSNYFPMLVNSWRKHFRGRDIPFISIQLPGFKQKAWPEMRDIQMKSVKSLKNTFIIPTIDCGEHNNIHYKNKLDVALRSAYMAMDKVYNEKIVSFTEVKSCEISGDELVLKFSDTSNGLKFDKVEPATVEILYEDGDKQVLEMKIQDKSTVVVNVGKKVVSRVRYAWLPFPAMNTLLINSDNIPIYPFEVKL